MDSGEGSSTSPAAGSPSGSGVLSGPHQLQSDTTTEYVVTRAALPWTRRLSIRGRLIIVAHEVASNTVIDQLGIEVVDGVALNTTAYAGNQRVNSGGKSPPEPS